MERWKAWHYGIIANYLFLKICYWSDYFFASCTHYLTTDHQHLTVCFTPNRKCYLIFFRMKFESVLAEVDGFGKYQFRTFFLMVIPRVTLPFHFLLNNFIAAVPSHHCDISSLDDGEVFRNLTLAEKLIVSIPVQEDGTPHSCQMFAEPQYHLLLNSSNITDLPTVSCQNGWMYDNTTFKSTVATEVSLISFKLDSIKLCQVTLSLTFLSRLFPRLRSKACSFRAVCPRSEGERCVFILYSVQADGSLPTVATLNCAHFPLLSVYWRPAEDYTSTTKTFA